MIVVRFVNEKRARNEQRKERRERERMRTPAGGRTAAGLPGCGPRGQGRRPSVRWREREREFEGRGACSCSSTNHSYRSQQSCTRRRTAGREGGRGRPMRVEGRIRRPMVVREWREGQQFSDTR